MTAQLEIDLTACEDPVVIAGRAYAAALSAYEDVRVRCARPRSNPSTCETCAPIWGACVDAYKAMTLAELRAA